MSFSQTKGKLVWGSPVFRIDLELKSSRVQQDFSGSMTLYERRHEITSGKFKSIEEFITKMKDLWHQSLRVDFIQDARLARWIEEYLSELDVTVDYNDILAAVRGRYVEVPNIEVEDAVELTAQEAEDLLPQRDQDTHISSGILRKIKYEIEDFDEMQRVLDSFLQQNKPKRSENAQSKIDYVHNGDSKVTEDVFYFQNSPIKSLTTLHTQFSNPHKEALENVVVNDLIPFDYQILEVKSVGSNVERLENEQIDKGLYVKWKAVSLPSGDTIKIDYSLIPKMLRTIIIRDDNDLNILQATEDVSIESGAIWIDSNYTFYDKTPIIENVKILDQIPGNLTLVRSTPDVVEPRGKLTHTSLGTEIIWSYSDVPALTQVKIEYELKNNPRMYRDVITMLDKDENHVADIYKIVKPLDHNSGYGLIYSIKAVKEIGADLIVQDIIPNSFEIATVHSDLGTLDQKTENGTTVINWLVNDLPLNKYVEIYFKITGDLAEEFPLNHFKVTSSQRELKEDRGNERTQKKETIIMPEFYDKIDS